MGYGYDANGVNPNIRRLTLSGSGVEFLDGGGSMKTRLIIRVTQDTRLAFYTEDLTSNYLTLVASTYLVLDPPNYLDGEGLYFRLDNTSGSDGVVEVVRC
jgi:hypothetical protein